MKRLIIIMLLIAAPAFAEWNTDKIRADLVTPNGYLVQRPHLALALIEQLIFEYDQRDCFPREELDYWSQLRTRTPIDDANYPEIQRIYRRLSDKMMKAPDWSEVDRYAIEANDIIEKEKAKEF